MKRATFVVLAALAACSGSKGSGSTTGAGATGGGSTGGSGSGSSGGTTAAVIQPGAQRGGGLGRTGVYTDPAFTAAAVAADAGLQVDPTFQSPDWQGPVFSQPLYFQDAATSKSMLVVTTDSNEVYALDAVTGATVWFVNQLVPPIDPGTMTCPGSVSPIGITGTPVIDPVARVLYLNAGTPVAGKPHYQIFALDLDDGSTVSGWPVDIDGLPMSLGNGKTGKFQSKWQNQRGALALVNGTLYVPYGGLDGDCGNYSGAVAAVPVATPSSVAIWATSAESGGGIWGPSGVASDGTSIYVATGNTNSPFPTTWPDANSEAVIRLQPGAPPVFSGAGTDYFAPSDPTQNWYTDDTEDADLGSSGVVLFDYPGSAAHPHLAFVIGKTSNGYLLDRTNLGGLSTGLSEIPGASSQVFGSMAAYTTATATYVVATASGNGGSCSGSTAAFAIAGDPPQLGGGWCSGNGGNGSPIVSTSDGTHDYLVWVTDGNLTALDGDTGEQVAQVGIPSGYTHWVTPIIAQGALYLAGNGQAMKFDP